MSNPSSSPDKTVKIPGILTSSAIMAPFALLASIRTEDIADWLDNSRLVRGVRELNHMLVEPMQEILDGLTWWNTAFRSIHIFSLVGVLILTAIADTGAIGAATTASFGLAMMRMLTTRMALKLNLIDVLVLVFFLTAVLSTAFSSYVATSLVGLAKFSVFLAGYISFRVAIGECPRALYWLLGTVLAMGVFESLVAFYQYTHHIQPLATWQDPSTNPEQRLTRVFGTLKPFNPNLLAGFLIPGVASGVGMAILMLFKTRWMQALFFAGLSLMLLVALVLTGSRGGFLAIAVMAAMTFAYLGHLLWYEPGLKHQYKLKALWLLTLIGGVAAVVVGVMSVPALQYRVMSIFAMREDSSNSYRMNVWISTWEMIKHNWLLGIGPGNNTFKLVYGLYMKPGYNALSAYSIFLEIWAEQGIFGILSFMLMLVTMKLRVFLAFCQSIALKDKLVLAFLLTGIAGSVVYGLFDTIWYRPSVNLLFWLMVAGFSVYSERAFHPIEEKAGDV